ncbi:MAG: nuclear transport factor 2 family protein [Acidimicrobiales bacterium]|nr:nuclear transport factor 2 family protein [Acidimicrobiales bacterium]
MTTAEAQPIDACLAEWHEHLRGEREGGLETLLRDDVVFYSPIVFSAITGKEQTMLYLAAAGNTFGGEPTSSAVVPDSAPAGAKAGGGFRYVGTTTSSHQAVLQFETTMAGKYVNGVDIITCDDDGRIVEFKVMIRPLQAVNTVHAQMQAMLEAMSDE